MIEPPTESELDVYVQGAGRVLCVFRKGKFRDRRILIREDLGKVWLFTPGTSCEASELVSSRTVTPLSIKL